MSSPETLSSEPAPMLVPEDCAAVNAPRRSIFATIIGIAVLGFLSGAIICEFRIFPYPQLLLPAFQASRGVYKKIATTSALETTGIWNRTRFSRRGAIHHAPEKSFNGYTLYASGHGPVALLVDMDGNVRHRWRLPFHEVWSDPPHVESPVGERFIYWRRVYMCPNGDLIVLYEGCGDTPYGYGLAKIDRNSKLIWKYSGNAHHDFSVAADGTILLLTHRFRDTNLDPVSDFANLKPIVLDDYVVRLSPRGKLLNEISVLDAFNESRYRELLTTVREDRQYEWDVLHSNSITEVAPEFAAHYASIKPGQALISMRSRQALAVVDIKQQQVVWADCGPYRWQHAAEPLANGNILLFDNQGHVGPEGPSRLLEYRPATGTIRWKYVGDSNNYFYSEFRSTQQQLPNGNLLVTESCPGRIFEITHDGELVWEYRNPVELDGNKAFTAIICSARRFAPDGVKFELDVESQKTYNSSISVGS